MANKALKEPAIKELPEGPFEAGQTLGLKPQAVLEKYLVRRNALITLLRIYQNIPAESIERELGLKEGELVKIEKSDELVPIQLIPKLARIFSVDLKMLLTMMGHTKVTEGKTQKRHFRQLGMAAQYSGPELNEQEKVDLEELFKMILDKSKQKKAKFNK